MGRTIIIIVLLAGFIPGLSAAKVNVLCEGSWKAIIVPENSPAGETLWFVVSGPGGVVQSEPFFAADRVTIELNLPDGEYRYAIKTLDAGLVEQGTFKIQSPFKVRFIHSDGDSAEFELSSSNSVYIEGYLLLGGSITDYTRFPLTGTKVVTIDGLKSGTTYTARFMVEGYYYDMEFVTALRNVALGMPVSGTFNRLPESRFVDDSTPAITRANDGSTDWLDGSAVSGDVNMEAQVVIINMLEPHWIRTARVVWSANYYPMQYKFISSRDGTNWVSIERSAGNYETSVAPDNSPIKVDQFEIGSLVQYVGIYIVSGEKIFTRQANRDTVQIMELEAYE